MKRIVLRTVPDPQFPTSGTVEYDQNVIIYADVIKQIIRRPLDPQKGADVAEMRKGIRILDALDKTSGGVLELEDADWEHLKEKTLVMPWAFVDRRVLDFCDAITDASENLTLNDQLDVSANGTVKEPVGV